MEQLAPLGWIVLGLAALTLLSRLIPDRKVETWLRPRSQPTPTPTLDEVIAAARGARFAIDPRPDGFVARDQRHSVRARVADPAGVAAVQLAVGSQDYELLVDALVVPLALALVPLYGPITLIERAYGPYVLDGTLDAAAANHDRRTRRIRPPSAHTPATK